MSKDQKKTKPMTVENVEKLKTACKIINEALSSFRYWNVDKIWPINLYSKGLEEAVVMINQVIFLEDTNEKQKDFVNENPLFVSRSHINDK